MPSLSGGFVSRPTREMQDAQYGLGKRYERGLGVPQNIVESHMWFTLAAAGSSIENRDTYVTARDAVAARMTAEQLDDAQRRVREWTPAPAR